MIRKSTYLSALLLAFMLAGCKESVMPENKAHVLQGKTMGTVWRVSMTGVDQTRAEKIRTMIEQQLSQDDQELSTWKSDSVLSRFNQYRGTAPQPVSENMADIIIQSLRIGEKTHGAMDITVGPLVNLWGFGPQQQPVKTPSARQVQIAKSQTGLQHLTVIQKHSGPLLQKTLPELYVDLSTVGEGFATDHLARLMEQLGISNYLVSVGGAVLTRGLNAQGKPWRVAIQKPTDRENVVEARVDLQGHGISTAGNYRNYYELEGKRISHIIDPSNGQPITHKLVSATVIATTALEADAWDTGLMVLGPEKARQVALKENLAVYLITKDEQGFRHWMSPQFSAFILPDSSSGDNQTSQSH